MFYDDDAHCVAASGRRERISRRLPAYAILKKLIKIKGILC